MNKEKAKTVDELLNQDNYVVPIYQRNYAWEKQEIDQLIDDITFAKSYQNNYFIGTLVTSDKGGNLFEIIDGQQRHTTLSLIHAVLIHHFKIGALTNRMSFNLKYEARPDSLDFFNHLHSDFTSSIQGPNNLAYAIRQIIIPKLELLRLESEDLDKWANYFYTHVKFFRVIVPKETDLHHYFETMNNRGKQLEEHEVLKAKFLAQLKDSKEESEEFSMIWDGCSNFSRYYVDTTYQATQIDKIGIDELLSRLKDEDDVNPDDESETIENTDYGSIIDFPNFLLIVLKMFRGEETTDQGIPLNDKTLLNSFGYYDESFSIDAVQFVSLLKHLRLLFDEYFIKRSYKDNTPYWVIIKYKGPNDKRNTFRSKDNENDDEDSQEIELQSKMVKVQSMLQAVYFTNNYKNWLFDALNVIHKSYGSTSEIIGNAVLAKLEDFALAKFKEQISEENYLPKDRGLAIQRIVFYYVDYLLWKTYCNHLRGDKTVEPAVLERVPLLGKILEHTEIYNRFTFKSYSSIEHFFARNTGNMKGLDDPAHSDNFGNLCLISRSMNSKYNNLNIPAKRKFFEDKIEKESLKQVIMVDYGDEFNSTEILGHEAEMSNFIEYHLMSD